MDYQSAKYLMDGMCDMIREVSREQRRATILAALLTTKDCATIDAAVEMAIRIEDTLRDKEMS